MHNINISEIILIGLVILVLFYLPYKIRKQLNNK
jgi:Sec-independent protein translocase protein TatA